MRALARAAAKAAPATNGKSNGHGRTPSPLRAQVVELAEDGLGPKEIASKLELQGRRGLIAVRNQLARARRAGQLPKAGAST